MAKRTWIWTAIVATLIVCGWLGAAAAGHPRALRSQHSEAVKGIPPMMVAVTEDGKLFHKPDCTFVHGPVKLEEGAQAVAEGYTACTRCMK